MRAIVIAADPGAGLTPLTDDRPQCMVEVAGKPILHHQLQAYQRAGIDDIVVIGGYKMRGIDAPGARVVPCRDYQTSGLLTSLFSAGTAFVGDVLVSYGDIFFAPEIAEALLESHAPGTLVVDRAWARIYEGREGRTIADAELCEISPHGVVTRVGSRVGPERAFGEFIGLARLNASMVAKMWAMYIGAVEAGEERSYGDADSLRQAALTDLINHAVARGEMFGVLAIEGGWREIHTLQDLERASSGLEWDV